MARYLLAGMMFCLAISARPSFAAITAPEVARQLLELGWSKSFKRRAEADSLYRQHVAAGGSSLQFKYAYLLVKLNQRRYREALKLADQILKVDKEHSGAQRARLWLLVITQDYENGLLAAESLARGLADAKQPKDERERTAGFLGQLAGFLEGPAGSSLPPDRIARFRRAAADVLKAELMAAFLENRDAVLERYAKLSANRVTSVAKAKADAEVEKNRVLKEVAEQRQQINQRKDDVRANNAKLESDLNKRLDELSARIRPLENERARIDIQGSVVNRELGAIVADIRYIEGLLARVKDPVLRDRYMRQLLRLDRLASRYEIDAATLDGRAVVNNVQRARISAEGQATRNRIGAVLKRNEDELKRLRKQQRRADIEERRAKRPTRNVTRTNRVLAARTLALSTYAPFPIERERKRLLESLKK